MFSPANPPTEFEYISTDVPPGVGLREWRREHAPTRRRGFKAKLLAAVHVGGETRSSSASQLRLA